MPDGVLALNVSHTVICSNALLQELPGLLEGTELAVQHSFQLHALGFEDSFYLVIRGALEGDDLLFAVHNQPQGHRLDTAGRQASADFAPQHGGELESDKSVQYPSGLLRVHEVEVYLTRILDSIEDGLPGDFVEHYPLCPAFVQSQDFAQVPRYGFSLTVLIGCQPYGVGFCRRLLQLADNLFLIGRNDVLGLEAVLHIHTQLAVLKVTYVPEA